MNSSTQRREDLQYYMHHECDAFRFQLAGRLSKDTAPDLEQAWRTASSVFGERCVIVDVSHLTSIDETGRELLSIWQRRGARLVAVSHQAARLQVMTDQTVTVLPGSKTPGRHRFRTLPLLVAGFLMFLFPVSAASLKTETLKLWEEYIQTVNLRIHGQANRERTFLWADEVPDRIAKARRGEILVEAVGANMPKEVPFGLIHDWIGVVFIGNATADQLLPVLRDYGRYKDFYRPAVIASKPIALSDSEDRFSMLLANRSLFRKSALDSDYRSSTFRVDNRRRYTIAQTTRIQEVAEYGATGQHTLPEDEGTGLIWRLFVVTRFEERDGGVYVETEAIALSRDIPPSLRWLIQPIVRRVAKASLINSLQQTRDAVRSKFVLK